MNPEDFLSARTRLMVETMVNLHSYRMIDDVREKVWDILDSISVDPTSVGVESLLVDETWITK